jgi:cytochrome c oxidase accessory protein FixG
MIEEEEFRDHVAHINEEGKRVWFFPKKPRGKYYNLRTYLSWFYLIAFFGLPFIRINGNPFFLLNVLERNFVLFGVRFWPQDFFLFVLGMLIFILFIVLFTVIFGRIFCGWACPQTIFMEMVFRKIEYFIEGDRNQQIALSNSAWNKNKITKRILKIVSFFLVSFLIANTFLMYIIGSDEVLRIAFEPITMHWTGLTAILIFSAVFFFVYYWFREQVCLIVCPYGRMQGVMLDKNSIAVTYDYVRGEPRTKHVKKTEHDPHGYCIDCLECVRVCPTGIDIRNGLQLECVNCTACMDICDGVMEKTHRPQGLIRYASEESIKNKRPLKFTKRMLAYCLVLVALIGLESFLLITRSDVEMNLVRTRNTLFTTETNGDISNLFNVKLINKTSDSLHFEYRIEGVHATFNWIGHKRVLAPGELINGELIISIPAQELTQQRNNLVLNFYANNEKLGSEKLVFIGPFIKK